jgi:hypothetical protein
MLANKMKRTKPGMETTRDGFEDLSRTLPQDMKSTWKHQEAQAREKGGKALSIYHISVETGLCMLSIATGTLFMLSLQKHRPKLKSA